MTFGNDRSVEPDKARAKREVAGVLAALGQLMRDLREQDLALQDAVSKLAAKKTKASKGLDNLQHLDLVTQTHEDLARFLPELAACLEHTNFDEERLAQKLRLRSLKDQLLDHAQTRAPSKTQSGDISFF